MRDTNIEAGSLERWCSLIYADIQNLAKVLISPDLSAVNDILSHYKAFHVLLGLVWSVQPHFSPGLLPSHSLLR